MRPPSSLPAARASRADLARSRRMLLLMALVFFGPLLIATGLYYTSQWRPVGHTNHGTLINPPRPLAGSLFQGKWSLVYVGSGGCNAACDRTLYYMRQTHQGLGRLYTRAQRVFVALAPCCGSSLKTRNPDLVIVDASSPAMASLLQNVAPSERASGIFIVDPRGNLMMRYDANDPPRGLLDDLKLLMGLSSIG
jgi:cytochrome oxidase Cu insertion factor (SCO1/SenC/PrrC family)